MNRLQKVLACVSIGLNALCAGGIFTFPLMSPVLAEHLKLTQPQLTTIVLAGMMSQYTVASFVGKVIDIHGPSICSLIAAVLFSCAFGGFAAEIHFAPENPSLASSLAIFRTLTLAFLGAGLGTVFAYFSSLFAASRIFPDHIGVASGTSMALFGLSPLFLSVIASTWFTDPATETFDVTGFTTFLAIFTGCVYLFGTLALRTNFPSDSELTIEPLPTTSDEEVSSVDETTSLLNNGKTSHIRTEASLTELVLKSDFWLLAVFCIITLGASEMIISNIGTIVLSLPPYSAEHLGGTSNAQSYTARQVKLLSISNTISRVSVGLLADFISPIASYLPSGVHVFPRKHRITRIAFLSISSLVLAITFFWMKSRVLSRDDIWALSVGTGIGYSAVFTVLPSIISSMWGMKNLGRNFGLMMYAPFVGNPLFSYLYAFVSESHALGETICQGRPCWQSTFSVTLGSSVVSLFISFVLWRRWSDKL